MSGKSQPRPSQRPEERLRKLSADLFEVAGEMTEEVSSKDAHRLRTTIRRIEVAVEPAGRFRGSKKLQRQFDKLRRAAGHVRDIDVQVELLHGLNAEDYGDDCTTLGSVLKKRRSKVEKKAVSRIAKEIDKNLKHRLDEAADAISDAPPRVAAATERTELIRQQYLEFTREIPQDGDALHNLRKACKRLRYRLEAIPGRESRALEKQLKGVQDAIGAWHDWATLTQEAEKRLAPRSIAFVAYLRSLAIAKRHEARRALAQLRERLQPETPQRKPPARAHAPAGIAKRAAR